MPVTSEIRGFVGDDYEMKRPFRDHSLTAGTDVRLGRLIGLDRCDVYVEKTAHAISAIIAARATTTRTTSNVVFLCSRKGLKPTVKR